MYRKPRSLFRRAFHSFLLGFAIFVLGVTMSAVLDRYGIEGVAALIDDLLIGALAGLLVFFYEHHQHRLMLERMRVVTEMNHHVRNALQTILYSSFMKEQAE